ncbi:Protein kinase domain-containing protein [Meloidogyne graminicola]|uniref:non-specific serine/threonine protein kinase n=1 Tax=Meloidogyne graminicola TaxID=189291 RepID=A0A8T0A1C8_9BILA|nr:Protein kinase domain-containing protein [Meloidogyne graminicola]
MNAKTIEENNSKVDCNPLNCQEHIQEQKKLCLDACALSDDENLSDLDEEEEDEFFRRQRFPYSSGSSPVSSFRMAVRQSRAPSACGKFNESLLRGIDDFDKIKSSLCVCNSIRQNTKLEEDKKEEDIENGNGDFPTSDRPLTDLYKISHEACYHKKSGEKFALKVLRDSARSQREISLHWLASRQRNVVSITDIFKNTFDGLNCLLVVVEFMQGGDLLTIFEDNGRSPYSEQCVARIIRQIGAAVQFLHERNIAHRDIKLENILCSTSNVNTCTFKLADFGFAKLSEADRPMNSPCCTPAYVCPEILSYKEYDKSCDIWALGVATYILLCGYPPFYSMQGLPFSPGMRSRITSGVFTFPSEDWDGISISTKHMISVMLRIDSSERISIQQLMLSEFISMGISPTITTKMNLFKLPPVPSDSSLSSDAGFESNPESITLKENNNNDSENESLKENKLKKIQKQNSPEFFLGKRIIKSDRQLPCNKCIGNKYNNVRPMLRERVYSIQTAQVDRALTFMRGNDCSNCCNIQLKNPSKGLTGSKLLERRRSKSINCKGGKTINKLNKEEEENNNNNCLLTLKN